MALRLSMWEKNWPEVGAALRGGAPGFLFMRKPQDIGNNVPVFCYHTVEREAFVADLDFLAANGYRTMSADGLLSHMMGEEPAPARSVVLTFDDGARNLYEVVYPALKQRGMVGVAFVCAGLHKEPGEQAAIINGHAGIVPPLDWVQMREMHRDGVIDFQSHGLRHAPVPDWPEQATLLGVSDDWIELVELPETSVRDEFARARAILEEKLDKTVLHLAFPCYKGTEEGLRIVADCGYRAAWWGVMAGRAFNRPGDSPWQVTRWSGEFVRRLPGEGRRPLDRILWDRYGGTLDRVLGTVRK
ncbi:polysaccharide deacetylase family protein [Oceanibacterium hippocampi]|uniref:Chitooligosaccharide deacetylase n=1 Tax=Oceanibacterium hippocampi TaxID=745714 RepID=A0A1Y5TYM4_9PROT|nr:polysaccharide deacetylase family protein [Oceanibacterium hippocampi]SLN75978.1 Polysaccharide deacetylase [Oceanibacterium hippocampi]